MQGIPRIALYVFVYLGATLPCAATSLTAEAINKATYETGAKPGSAIFIKVDVLLDRAGFSPGVIDGRDGENFKKAVRAFQRGNGLDATGGLNPETFEKLAGTSSEPIMTEYEISQQDTQGPFVKRIPTSFEKMAKLHHLSYTGPRQELAEKFHMDENLLATLNPGAVFNRARTRIIVANVVDRPQAKVDKILVDKQERSVSAFDDKGNLVAYYPASVGSEEKPAPSGVFKVKGVDKNPTYHYDPKFAFKGVKAKHKLTIRPGPKNPVGLVWISLTAPSYGIHGTPSPEKVSKTESHGCIRLTNWDALALASMVHPGTVVDFEG